MSTDELVECERVIRNRARLEQVARSGVDAMPTELTVLLGEYDWRGADLRRLCAIEHAAIEWAASGCDGGGREAVALLDLLSGAARSEA